VGALRLPLWRIDLARVVSKCIGETEKNLDDVFAAAERAVAMVLFDEAEALFGKRSEVHDAHDRYANLASRCRTGRSGASPKKRRACLHGRCPLGRHAARFFAADGAAR
jgi:SpoVK/Ycf46/Vps4 family AAA+-type ATPase